MATMTNRLTHAVDYARMAHATQVRKGSNVPYLYHLLGVASLVLEFGGSEDQVIAGLLHDTIEDCGAEHEEAIRQQFGEVVASIVVACTDGSAEDKALHESASKKDHWLERKRRYVRHLAHAPESALLVSACDKLHNARAIVQDLEDPSVGHAVFERFTGGRDGTLAYYETLRATFVERGVASAAQLTMVVDRMHVLAGESERHRLG